nr:ROK family protein [uncultured Holophaga sp.]
MPPKPNPTILSLDAGGTTLTFCAIREARVVGESFTIPSRCQELGPFLEDLKGAFRKLRDGIGGCDAISFGFPGPADYPSGVIGDLWNMPAFRDSAATGGVPLGPILSETFGVPVFINNDADLFALGEAHYGLLPEVNARLEAAGTPKRYRNLLGLTLGTGFGGGIVLDGRLHLGDNAAGAEIWLLRHKLEPQAYAEEGVSIRAVRGVYAQLAGIPLDEAPDPKTIAAIARGRLRGPARAARESWRRLGEVAGEAIATALTLVDGLVVIGGGLSAASDLYMPALLGELNGSIRKLDGRILPRLAYRVHDLDQVTGMAAFLTSRLVHGRDTHQRSGIAMTRLGTSRATALGAYAYAVERLGGTMGRPPASE